MKKKRKKKHNISGDCIHSLADVIGSIYRPDFVAYCRVSHAGQERDGNLDDQISEVETSIKKIVQEMPFDHTLRIKPFREVCNGSIVRAGERQQLRKAITFARKHNAVIVALSRDRLLRHDEHKRTFDTESPTKEEYDQLLDLAGDVPLLTISDPNASCSDVRSSQIRRGQRTKRNKGGRPSKAETKSKVAPGELKQRRIQMRPFVIQLRARGSTFSDITEAVNRDHNVSPPISSETVRCWCREFEKELEMFKTQNPCDTWDECRNTFYECGHVFCVDCSRQRNTQ